MTKKVFRGIYLTLIIFNTAVSSIILQNYLIEYKPLYLVSLIFTFIMMVGSFTLPLFGHEILFKNIEELQKERENLIKIKNAYSNAEQKLIKKTLGRW